MIRNRSSCGLGLSLLVAWMANSTVAQAESSSGAETATESSSEESQESASDEGEQASESEVESATGEEAEAESAENADSEEETATDEERAEQARAAFAQAQASFSEGRFETAAMGFEEAHRLRPHAAFLFNAARAWQQGDQLERAADAYAAAIKRGELGYDQSSHAQKTLESLRTRLGWAKLTGEEGTRVTLSYHESVPLPLETHLASGEHLIRVSDGEGGEWEQSVSIAAAQPLRVRISKPAPPPEPEVVAPVVVPPDNRARERQSTWGWATLSVGAGLGVTAAILGGTALGAKKDYEESDPADAQLYARARDLRTWTNVLAFTGIAVGGTGAVLLLTLPAKEGGEEKVAVGVSPNRITLSGRF